MKKTLLILAAVLGLVTSSYAQVVTSHSSRSYDDSESPADGIFNHFGVGVGVGLTGIDIEVGAPCTHWLQFRTGVTFMPFGKFKGLDADMNVPSGTVWEEVGVTEQDVKNIKVDAGLNMTNFKLMADFYPFKTSSFHLTAGFYWGKSQLFDVTANSAVLGKIWAYNMSHPEKMIGMELGDTKIYPQGTQMQAYVQVNGFKPYLGLGFGRIVPRKTRLCFNFDAGVQFWGHPTIKIDQTDLSETISNSGGGDVVKIMSKITVYPVLNFRLTGRIL